MHTHASAYKLHTAISEYRAHPSIIYGILDSNDDRCGAGKIRRSKLG